MALTTFQASNSPVTDNTTDVVNVFKDNLGNQYLDIQVTTTTGTGPAPEPAGTHVFRVPVIAKLS